MQMLQVRVVVRVFCFRGGRSHGPSDSSRPGTNRQLVRANGFKHRGGRGRRRAVDYFVQGGVWGLRVFQRL